MQRYRRPLGDGPLKYRGKRYAGGTVVQMAAAHATPLLERGRLEAVSGDIPARGSSQPQPGAGAQMASRRRRVRKGNAE